MFKDPSPLSLVSSCSILWIKDMYIRECTHKTGVNTFRFQQEDYNKRAIKRKKTTPYKEGKGTVWGI